MARNTALSTTSRAALDAAGQTPPESPPTPGGGGKPPVVMRPIWVTVGNAMRLTGLGRTKLYELITDGTLRSTTVGRRRLISLASIEALGSEGA